MLEVNDVVAEAEQLLVRLLQSSGLWGSDPLPIAFLLYRDRARYIGAARKLIGERDWSAFVPYMAKLLGAAAELSVLIRYSHPAKTPAPASV